MQKDRTRAGFVLRDAFEQELKGAKTICEDCGKFGLIGKGFQIVYREQDTPFGRIYSVGGICEQCQEKRIALKQ